MQKDEIRDSNINIPRKERQGIVFRFLDGLRKRRKRIQDHPVKNAAYTLIVFLAAFGASEAYQFGKARYLGEGAYIQQLKDDQAAGFKDLKEGLAALRGAVDGPESKILAGVDKSVRKMDALQKGMLRQLDLAKAENATLSAALESQRGIPGGYDFMLSEGGGFALSEDTFIGVSDIRYGKQVVANLTAPGEGDINKKYLESGQSIPFRNAKGRACKVAVLTVEEDAASFKVGCS